MFDTVTAARVFDLKFEVEPGQSVCTRVAASELEPVRRPRRDRDGTACVPGPVRVGDCRSLVTVSRCQRWALFAPATSDDPPAPGRHGPGRRHAFRLQPAAARTFRAPRRIPPHLVLSLPARPGPGLHRHGQEARAVPRAGPPCFRRPPRFFPRLLSRCCHGRPRDPGAEGTRALDGLGFQQMPHRRDAA
jgi:hypothetical protein